MSTSRPRGLGLYETINLGRARRDDLRETHRDRDDLRAVPDADPARTAEAMVFRAASDFGGSPREALRRMLDAEMGRSRS
jgi:hypothetical protein